MSHPIVESTSRDALQTVGTRSLTSYSLSDALSDPASPVIGAWESLLTTAPDASYLHDPEWVRLELTGGGGTILACERESQIEGLAILLPKSVRTSTVGALGYRPTLTGLRLQGDAVLATGAEVASRLLDGIDTHLADRKADVVVIEEQLQTSLLSRAIDEGASRSLLWEPGGWSDHWTIPLRELGEEYWTENFTSKQRRKIRYQNRRMEWELRCYRTVSDVADFLDAAARVSEKTWQSDSFGVRIANDEQTLAKFVLLAERGWLRSYVLWLDGTPASFVVGTERCGHFRYEETGYDRDFAKVSAGQVLLALLLAEQIESDTPELFDFGFGTADYKELHATQHDRSRCLWMLPNSFKARRTLGHLNRSRSARQFAKRSLDRIGLRNRARNLLRKLRASGSENGESA